MLQAFNELPDAVRYGLAFGIPCLVTLFATPFAARAAIRLGLVDHPAPHKTHVDPTPYLGGAAVAAGIGVAGVVAAGGSIQIATILVAAMAIACLGLVDDARGLQPPVKLASKSSASWCSPVLDRAEQSASSGAIRRPHLRRAADRLRGGSDAPGDPRWDVARAGVGSRARRIASAECIC